MSDEGRFGPYIIESVLGEGAAAVVYRARHQDLDRPVALKVLGSRSAGVASMEERFRREAVVIAQLRHPNIVRVHDAGEVDGRAFLAMELVEGQTLDGLLDRGAVALRAGVELLAKVADGAHHAHEHGIVHRDLKPANVLVDANGEPKIVDFGLARVAELVDRLTRDGSAMGTPLYMSPEQVAGRSNDVGPRSDVYALGAILYELLTGRTPFMSETVTELFQRILESDPEPPGRVRPGVPPPLEAVCLKALEREPRHRHASAAEFATDLRAWLAGKPVGVRSHSVVRSIRRQFVRRRTTVTASVVGVLALALAAAIFAPRWSAERARATEERRLRQEAELFLPVEKELELLALRGYHPDFRMTDADFSKFDGEIAQLREHMSRGRESARGWHLIGRVREVLADHAGADEAWGRGLQIEPEHAACLFDRGRLAIERALVKRGTESGEGDTAVQEAASAMDLVRRGVRLAAGGSRMELDLAQAYLDVIERWGTDWRFESAPLLEKWKGKPFVEEFLLLEGIAGGDLAARASEAIRRMPGYARAWFWRGTVTWTQDSTVAIADFDRAIAINPRFAEAYGNRGIVRRACGDDAGALADVRRAIELNPRLATPRVTLGNILSARGDVEGALASLDDALKLSPRSALAFSNRGLVWQKKGDLDRAFADFNRATEFSPRYAQAYHHRAGVYWLRKDGAAAIADFDRAIELEENYADAYGNRGVVRRAMGDAKGAMADYDRAIQLSPRSVNALYNRGNIKAAQGDRIGAIADYDRAIAVDPGAAGVYYNRGNMRRDSGDQRGALADYEKTIGLDPKHVDAFMNRGNIRKELGDLDGSMADQDSAIALDPRYPGPYVNRGEVKRLRGDSAGAAADWKKALEVAPADWHFRPRLEQKLRELRGGE